MEITKNKESINVKKAAVAGVCACALALGGVMSYLTATDTATNKFELADSTAYASAFTVEEPGWDTTDNNSNGIPDAAEGFLPTQTITKDPQVKNDSNVSSYIMVTLKVPTATVQCEGESSATQQELFTYSINSGWTEKGTGTYADGFTTHVYMYDTALAGGGTTSKLFNSVTLKNIVNGQIESGSLAKDIVVTANAIQAQGFSSADEAYAQLSE